ncbi:hypothetical protein GCM10012275_54570 [Longimycelium tulufanense]|uniref:Phage major capsid protein n=1 Tax=Longimycelium tulufanense TaxID=907463 RepID=A0A8J3FX64_9PSEU|nr:phage major capsid protein [Longimycelium tulufanense]GGM77011.1 hypothetical protein GCM10012275_54570 [Longimycelium tulufanense]
MPVTLAQAQVNTQSDVDYAVIDNLRRYSWLFDQIVFDDTVTPGTNGASLVYGYVRLTAARSAQFRAFNSEYTPLEAQRQQFTVGLHPLGGAFNVDRTLANLGRSSTNETSFQLQQLLISVKTKFAQELILGDTAVDTNGFDGLSKALAGSDTEVYPGTAGANFADWSPATLSTVDRANDALDLLDDFLSRIVPSQTGGGMGSPGDVPPGVKALLGNTRSITRVRSIARRAGTYTNTKDDLGREVQRYGEWVLIDIGDRMDGASPIIPIEDRDTDLGAGTNTQTNLTDLYAISFGLDAFHAASAAGKPLVQSWLPDFSTAGAVKTGEVEMGPLAGVLKNTRACGVLRNIKVA